MCPLFSIIEVRCAEVEKGEPNVALSNHFTSFRADLYVARVKKKFNLEGTSVNVHAHIE